MMSHIHFLRRLAPTLLALQFAGGGMLALAAPARAEVATVGEHGVWQVFSDVQNGHQTFAVVSKMNHGGYVSFIFDDDKVTLYLTKHGWSLDTTRSLPIEIRVDGHAFAGTASASDSHTIKAEGVKPDFVKMLTDGQTAIVTVADIEWTLTLDGFADSLHDAVRPTAASLN